MIRKSKFDPGIMCYEAGLDAPQSLRDTLAVEAHEVGHILTGSEDEETAELFAIALLRASGYHTSAQLLLDRGIVTGECKAMGLKV